MSQFSPQAAREQRNALAKEIRNLLDNNTGANWKPEHQKQYDEEVDQIGRIDDELARNQKILDINAEKDFSDVLKNGASGQGGEIEVPKDFALKMYGKFLRQGEKAITQQEWQQLRNTMSTTTTTEGGYTVPSLISSQLFDAMKAFGTMRVIADVIQTADGKPLSFPTSDGTAETGEWIAQNTTATAADPSFGTASLNVYKASSKIVAVPYELLQDTTIDMEAFIRTRLGQRLGRLGNTAFTVGTGTTQPDGIVPKASSGKVGTTGQTLTIIYDDIVDLIHAVDPAYRGPGCSFMTNDSLLKVLRKIKDTAGRPIWTPSYDGGLFVGLNQQGQKSGGGGFNSQTTPVIYDYLLGYPVWVNNDIAVPAANAKTMLFGDYSYYKIRDAMDVSLFRFTDSAYTKLGQIGFLAWARMGGNLMDTNAVKYYQHSAT